LKKLLLYTSLGVLLCSCENKLEQIMALDKSAVGIEEGYDIKVIISQAGHVKAELTGPYMQRNLQHPASVEFSKGMKVLFYDDSLNLTSTLTAKYGKYFESNGDIFLKDSVVFINIVTHARMDCHRLKYDAMTQKFSSDTAVRYIKDGAPMFGTSFVSNSDFSDMSLEKAHGDIQFEQPMPVVDSAVVDSTAVPVRPARRDNSSNYYNEKTQSVQLIGSFRFNLF
jgi:LPS export ABC transporter protein LptC